jgi:hypothetical protein
VLSLDLRIAKTVAVGGADAQLLVEAFNVTDAVNYGDFIGTITSSRFGEPTTAAPPRRLHLGVRVDF